MEGSVDNFASIAYFLKTSDLTDRNLQTKDKVSPLSVSKIKAIERKAPPCISQFLDFHKTYIFAGGDKPSSIDDIVKQILETKGKIKTNKDDPNADDVWEKAYLQAKNSDWGQILFKTTDEVLNAVKLERP